MLFLTDPSWVPFYLHYASYCLCLMYNTLWIINIIYWLKHFMLYRQAYNWAQACVLIISPIKTTTDMPITITCKIMLAMIWATTRFVSISYIMFDNCWKNCWTWNDDEVGCWLRAKRDLFTLLKFQKHSSMLTTKSKAGTKPVNQKQ